MSTDPIEAAAIGDRLKLIRILLNHAAEFPAIMGHLEEVKNATTLTAKWDAFKGAGDLLVPIAQELKDAYADTSLHAFSEGHFRTLAISRGVDWNWLISMLPKLQKALPLLLELLDLFGGE